MAKYYNDPSTGQRVLIRKTHKFRNFVVLPALGVVALIVIIAAATSGGSTSAAAAPGNGPAAVSVPTSGTAHVVTYEATGNGSGSVTYATDGTGSIAQDTGADLPWTQEVKIDSVFAAATMNVQHMNGSGPITCKITVDGEVVSENTSNGQYAIASCTATIQ